MSVLNKGPVAISTHMAWEAMRRVGGTCHKRCKGRLLSHPLKFPVSSWLLEQLICSATHSLPRSVTRIPTAMWPQYTSPGFSSNTQANFASTSAGTLSFQWVLSHCGITGNKSAIALAAAAHTSACTAILDKCTDARTLILGREQRRYPHTDVA